MECPACGITSSGIPAASLSVASRAGSENAPYISALGQDKLTKRANQEGLAPFTRLAAPRHTAQGALFCRQPAQGEVSAESISA